MSVVSKLTLSPWRAHKRIGESDMELVVDRMDSRGSGRGEDHAESHDKRESPLGHLEIYAGDS